MQPVFRILGPLEVELEERTVALGRRERAFLGVLLLYAGEVVSVERLIDGVWGETPPSSAKHMVHEYVFRLRNTLGVRSPIETTFPGYVATCADGDLDVRVFSQLVATARVAAIADDHAQALRSYDDALRLWRGEALAGVELAGEVPIDVARLDEEHRLVAEERVDSALALGRHRDLIPELERRVREAPLRERPRQQVMLALYRAGRQADALEHYRQARALLVDHAGIEPGPELRRLERAILQHDPALELAPPPRRRAPNPPGPVRRVRRGRRAGVALAGIGVAGLVAAGAWLEFRGRHSPPIAPVTGNAVAAIDAQSGRVTGQISVGPSPSAIAVGAGSLWVANVDANRVSRIDPVKRVVVQTITVGGGPAGIAFGDGFVWVTNGLDGTVSKIDPKTNSRVQTIPVGNAPAGIAVDAHDVWVANSNDRTISRIDPVTGKPHGPAIPMRSGSDGIAVGDGSVWVTSQSAGTVTRLDAHSLSVIATIETGNGAAAVAVGAGSAWVANSLAGTVTQIDPISNDVHATIHVGDNPNGIAVLSDAVWVSSELAGTLSRIDPASGSVIDTVRTGGRPEGVAFASGSLMVAVRASGTGHRGGTLRVLAPSPLVTTYDPADAYSTNDWQMLALTNDGLTGFRRVGGGAGTRVIPDLAVSLPAATNRDRTYRFQLRTGIHYSTGALVRPRDFRRAIERSLAHGSLGDYYSQIVGAPRCLAAPGKPCDLSEGIVADPAANTVTFHLSAPDPDFLVKLSLSAAYAVPDGTPIHLHRPLPATGPYMIASYDPKKTIRLVRNPRFHEWSPAVQPDGFPDRIVERVKGSPDVQVAAVLNGSADLMSALTGLSPGVLDAVRTQHASQVELTPSGFTFYLALNTRVSPFDDVRVRQALNLAVDRRRLRDVTVGPGLDQVTCQILPPNFDGYQRYCPYTAKPNASGTWRAPDMARARQLVRASGTAGEAVTVWVPNWDFGAGAGPYIVSVLDSLGYHARSRHSGDPYAPKHALRIQAGFSGFAADFATPSGFFFKTFTCASSTRLTSENANVSEFCDTTVDHEIAHARSVQASDQARSSHLWANVDHDVVDLAPWVPFANGVLFELISSRVRNYQHNPQLGTLLDQLWVR
jgi:peptide/nickel transport system substrate-binding protein